VRYQTIFAIAARLWVTQFVLYYYLHFLPLASAEFAFFAWCQIPIHINPMLTEFSWCRAALFSGFSISHIPNIFYVFTSTTPGFCV